jgi:DNA invertase Pin-like site-specific DNA recombinase
MNTAIYLRVSTFDQNHSSQEDQVKAFCHRAGWTDAIVYRDTMGGSTQSRPELERLLEDCRSGKIERLVVYKLDRIGRSVLHLSVLLTELRTLKIPIIFTSQGFSTEENNPASELFVNILCAMAQFEKDSIRERVRAGLHVRKLKGLPLGRKPTADKIKQECRTLRTQGMSIREISDKTKLSIGTVHKACK